MDPKGDTYDGSGWFTDKPPTNKQMNAIFRRWGRRINELRAERSKGLQKARPMLPLKLFRSHSLRHGRTAQRATLRS